MSALLAVLAIATGVLLPVVAWLHRRLRDVETDLRQTRALLALHLAGRIVAAHLVDMSDLRNATTVEDVLRGEDR